MEGSIDRFPLIQKIQTKKSWNSLRNTKAILLYLSGERENREVLLSLTALFQTER